MTTPTVGDATEFIRGITFKPHELIDPDDPDAIVCMRTKNVQRDLDEVDLIAVPSRLVRNSEKLLRSGDILISSANSWELVGKCSYVKELNYRATAGGFIAIVRPKAHTHPRFLYHWMICPKTQHLLRHCGRQTTNISNLDVNRFKELEFPDIGCNEQRRMAAILDKADAIRRKCEQSLDLADEFLKSVFLEMFGDPLTNSKSLPTKPISAFGKIVTGNTPPRANPKNYGSHIEWIKSDNINNPEHFLTRASEYLSIEGMQLGRVVPTGSILVICIAGSSSSIGKASVADRDVALNAQINAITPNANVDHYFLYSQFLVGQRLIQSASTKSMKGMVSKGKFQEIHFLAPEPKEQKEFGKVFKKYLKNNRCLREAHRNSSELFGSLSQRAFRGDL